MPHRRFFVSIGFLTAWITLAAAMVAGSSDSGSGWGVWLFAGTILLDAVLLIGWIGIVRELRALEERIRAAEAQREKSRLEFDEANQQLATFSYTIAHDLRSPMRHIEGFLGLLVEEAGTSLNAPARRFLDKAREATLQMGKRIDGLLAFSKLGRNALQCATRELDPILAEVVAELEAEHPDATIHWEIAPLPACWIDAALIRQVFWNLLDNALKFRFPERTPRIEIGLVDGADECEIVVRDNGMGFESGQADKLFGVFQRLHHDTDLPGTGIGLASVQRIVARHGGRIMAESIPGMGSTFRFTLPKHAATWENEAMLAPRKAAEPNP